MGQKSLICVVEKTLGASCGKKTIEVLGEIDYVYIQNIEFRSQNTEEETLEQLAHFNINALIILRVLSILFFIILTSLFCLLYSYINFFA